MDLAEVTDEIQVATSETYRSEAVASLLERAEDLKVKVAQKLKKQGISTIDTEVYFSMRLQGTDTNLMILEPPDGNFAAAFHREFTREFTYLPQNREVFVEAIRVRGKSKVHIPDDLTPFDGMEAVNQGTIRIVKPKAAKESPVYFKGLGRVNTPIYSLKELETGSQIKAGGLNFLFLFALIVSYTVDRRSGSRYDHRRHPDNSDSAQLFRECLQ